MGQWNLRVFFCSSKKSQLLWKKQFHSTTVDSEGGGVKHETLLRNNFNININNTFRKLHKHDFKFIPFRILVVSLVHYLHENQNKQHRLCKLSLL